MEIFIYYLVLIYIGALFLIYCKVCKKEMKQIPVRKIDSLIIIEEYCPCCDESNLRYEKIQVI
jgi:hypothetical protein